MMSKKRKPVIGQPRPQLPMAEKEKIAGHGRFLLRGDGPPETSIPRHLPCICMAEAMCDLLGVEDAETMGRIVLIAVRSFEEGYAAAKSESLGRDTSKN